MYLHRHSKKTSSRKNKCTLEHFVLPKSKFDHNWHLPVWLSTGCLNCGRSFPGSVQWSCLSSVWEAEIVSSNAAFLLSAPDRSWIKEAFCELSYYLITGCHFKTILKSFAALCSAIVVALAFPLNPPLVFPAACSPFLLSFLKSLHNWSNNWLSLSYSTSSWIWIESNEYIFNNIKYYNNNFLCHTIGNVSTVYLSISHIWT